MITLKSIPRIISISIASFFLAINLAIAPVSMSQTAVNTLTTVEETPTNQPDPYTSGGTKYEYGKGKNLTLTGFEDNNGDKFNLFRLVDQINIKRSDNNNKQLVFFEGKAETSNNIIELFPGADPTSVEAGAKSIMEDTLLSDIINRGSDNVFNNNTNATNFNNIERVDFVATDGLSAPNPQQIGFLILERNGNDPFGIAPITSIDGNGNPTAYGDLLPVGTNEWSDSGIGIDTQVLRDDNDDDRLRASAYVTGQTINSIFFSYEDLGITADETFYGYSLFGGDVDSNDDLLAPNNFPTNTGSGDGGLDLIASGGVFSSEALDVAVTKEVTKIDDPDDENDNPTSNLDRANLGDEITYKITVINNDTSIAANEYNVTDTFPSELKNISWDCEPDPSAATGTDCTPNDNANSNNSGTGNIDETVNIAPGDSVIYTVTATVGDPDAIGIETISNTAEISATRQNDTDTSNNSSTVKISINPRVRLIKRITKVNNDEDSGELGNWSDDTNDDNDNNDVNWPKKNTFLTGAINGIEVEPGDELEYTIYFLSDGGQAARNVRICDLITENQTFVRDAFNDQGTNNKGIAALIPENSLKTTPNKFFTNIGGDDQGTFIPAGSKPPSECKKVKDNGDLVNLTANDNKDGVVVVDVVEGSDALPPATSPGKPKQSYGFIRFRTKVDEVFNDDQKRQDKQTQKQEN